MKAFFIISFAFLGLSNAEFCYNQIHTLCTSKGIGSDLQSCNAKFSAAHQVMPDLQEYVKQHLSQSFQYLLMSTNFGDYEKNRLGFSKLYRKLSDSTWDDAIDLIKYITKRGGTMQFDVEVPAEPNPIFNNNLNMHELESLSRALDMYKSLAEKAHSIHSEVTRRKTDYHDAETLSYLEKEFVHKHADTIRDLAGHTNDLSSMLMDTADSSLSVFLFDEYLQKLV
uniref:Ferritin n=1 Tax=Pristhesancus plagipennis TaxID=1955184 RepID=A0A2K8JML0_PRIPG|nr:secreted Ferritin-like protein [Pristhesancus plagipennis]